MCDEALRREFHSVIAGFCIGRSLRSDRSMDSITSKVVYDYPCSLDEAKIIGDADLKAIATGKVLVVDSNLPFINTLSAPRFISFRRMDGKPRVIVDHSVTGANASQYPDGRQRNSTLETICSAISQPRSIVIVADVVGYLQKMFC